MEFPTQETDHSFLFISPEEALKIIDTLIAQAKQLHAPYHLSILSLLKRQYLFSISTFEEAKKVRLLLNQEVFKIREDLNLAKAPTDKQLILFLASSPSDAARLQHEKEFVRILNSLKEGTIGFELESEWAITPRRLQSAILKYEPHIIHFSGHGGTNDQTPNEGGRSLDLGTETAEQTGLYLQGANGKKKFVAESALTNMFKIFSRKFKIKVVVLNACHSELQAKAISEYVPYVVGMNEAITDSAAIEFSTTFYRSMADSEDIELAFELARNAIQLEGQLGETIPVLYKEKNIINKE